jgi:hypothetical protein
MAWADRERERIFFRVKTYEFYKNKNSQLQNLTLFMNFKH